MLARLGAQTCKQTTPRAFMQTRRAISVQVRRPIAQGSWEVMRDAQSLLHGSPEAKEEGDVSIQQHSRLVARGKYVHGFEGASLPSVNSPNV